MNAPIKISLLSAGVVGAVVGILSFQKTIAQPPAGLDMPDQFAPSVEEDINKISDADGFDTLFVSITTSIKFLADNELITPEKSKELTSELYAAYVPVFCERSKRYFRQSDWSESELNGIRLHSKFLTNTDKKQGLGLSLEMKQDLGTLRNVVGDYYAAVKAAKVGSFRSLEHSKQKISAAKDALQKEYIPNCTWLKTKLENVPKTLSDKHYDYIERQVDKLSSHRQNSPQEFSALYDDVISKINEYDSSQAKEIYGASRVRSTESLRGKAWEWYRKANEDTDWQIRYSRH